MSAAMTGRRVVLARRPQGHPRPGDFAIESFEPAAPTDGELLIETHWLAVDPMLAIITAEAPLGGAFPPLPIGTPIPAAAVSRVIESRHPDFKAGDWVEGRTGWRTGGIAPAADVRRIDGDHQPEALGLLGLSGFSGWCGLVTIDDLAGKTVMISAASGAVGGAAGQIARHMGARAIGIAGGAEKCRYVREELDFDDVLDHRAPDFADRIAAIAGQVDVYFDNVGGDLLVKVLPALARHATILICGLMGNYTQGGGDGLADLLNAMMSKGLHMRGFNNREFLPRIDEFERMAVPMVADGRLRERYDIKAGLEGAIAHLSEMFTGDVVGKRLARLDVQP